MSQVGRIRASLTGPDSEATIVFLENAQAMAAHESPVHDQAL